jgi:hypothetical protein
MFGVLMLLESKLLWFRDRIANREEDFFMQDDVYAFILEYVHFLPYVRKYIFHVLSETC